VTFTTDALGGVRGIKVVLGEGATELDLLEHVATVQRLQEWVGAAGWVRGAWARARGQARAGQLRFEAMLEIEKLDAMVQVRRVLLEKQPLAPGTASALEQEIQVLARQREQYAQLAAETGPGRGVVAASFDEEEELGKLLSKMFDEEVARQGAPRAKLGEEIRPGTGEPAATFDEEELGRTFSRMYDEAMATRFELLDWSIYSYVGRRLGIVDTPQGPQAWYIRTGKGGQALAGEPAAGDPARFHGFAHLQVLDAGGKPKVGEFRKWFMKPEGGRAGEGNDEVSAWLQEQAEMLRTPSPWTAEVPRTDPADVSDIKRLNDWLRSRGITPGEGHYPVGKLVLLLDETELTSMPTAPAVLEIGGIIVPRYVEKGGIIWEHVLCRILAIP
jgi:hypothetical protein